MADLPMIALAECKFHELERTDEIVIVGISLASGEWTVARMNPSLADALLKRGDAE